MELVYFMQFSKLVFASINYPEICIPQESDWLRFLGLTFSIDTNPLLFQLLRKLVHYVGPDNFPYKSTIRPYLGYYYLIWPDAHAI